MKEITRDTKNMKVVYAIVVSYESLEGEWEHIYGYYESRSKAQSKARRLVKSYECASARVMSVKCENDCNINDNLYTIVGVKEYESKGFSKILYVGNDFDEVRNKFEVFKVSRGISSDLEFFCFKIRVNIKSKDTDIK